MDRNPNSSQGGVKSVWAVPVTPAPSNSFRDLMEEQKKETAKPPANSQGRGKPNSTNETWRSGEVNRERKKGQEPVTMHDQKGGGQWGRGSQQPGNAFTTSLRDGNSQENSCKLGTGSADGGSGLDEPTKEHGAPVKRPGMTFTYTPSSPKIKSGTTVVNVHKANLLEQGYNDLEAWVKAPGHVYIGRDMTRHVPGAVGSKWGNPYSAKKYTSAESCQLYKEHILNSKTIHENGKTLFESLEELKGKVLGCWCHPDQCHGHVLQSLVEKYCCSEDHTELQNATEGSSKEKKPNRTNETWRSGEVNRGRKKRQEPVTKHDQRGGGQWGRGSQQPGNAYTASLRDGNSQENSWKLGTGSTDEGGGLDEPTNEETGTALI